MAPFVNQIIASYIFKLSHLNYLIDKYLNHNTENTHTKKQRTVFHKLTIVFYYIISPVHTELNFKKRQNKGTKIEIRLLVTSGGYWQEGCVSALNGVMERFYVLIGVVFYRLQIPQKLKMDQQFHFWVHIQRNPKH